MADISVSAAAGAGFRLIGAKPLSVFAWGLLMVLLAFAPFVALFAQVVPQFIDLVREQTIHPGAPPNPATILALYGNMGGAYSVLFLGGLLSTAIVNAAVFRAVIEPRNRGFAYMRFGMQEIWLLVLAIAEGLLWLGMIIVSVIAVVLISMATSRYAGNTWAVVASVLMSLLALFVMILVGLRLSMAAPMTFAEGEFRLFESWRMTRGHAWRIFLVALLLMLILIGVGFVVQMIERIAFLPVILSYATDPHAADHFRAMAGQPQANMLRAIWPYILAGAVGFSIYVGVMRTIVAAPWATVYRMLKGEAAAA